MGFGFLDIDALTPDIASWEVFYETKSGPLLDRQGISWERSESVEGTQYPCGIEPSKWT